MNRNEVLLEFAKIEHDEARSYENQRERLFGFAFVATGAILAAIYSDPSTTSFDVILAGIATLFNAFKSITSLKFYLSFKRRYERYRVLRSEIDKDLGAPILEDLMEKASGISNEKGRYRLVEPLKLHVICSSLSWMMSIISGSLRPRLFRLGRQEPLETLGIAQDEASVLDLDPPLRRELAQDRGRHVA